MPILSPRNPQAYITGLVAEGLVSALHIRCSALLAERTKKKEEMLLVQLQGRATPLTRVLLLTELLRGL